MIDSIDSFKFCVRAGIASSPEFIKFLCYSNVRQLR